MTDTVRQADIEPDRRKAVRHRTRRKAVVVTNSGWSTINAEILNLSADGALLQLEGIGAFPQDFQLRFDGRKQRVTRIWNRGLQAGVAFDKD